MRRYLSRGLVFHSTYMVNDSETMTAIYVNCRFPGDRFNRISYIIKVERIMRLNRKATGIKQIPKRR